MRILGVFPHAEGGRWSGAAARWSLIAVAVALCAAMISPPAAAHYYSSGMPTPVLRIAPYSYNSSWQGPMDQALSNWTATPTPAWIYKLAGEPSQVIAAQYPDTWYGYYNLLGVFPGNYLRIRLNARTISRDASNFGNFVTSVLVHEFGHALRLSDNPGISGTSIMKESRNRNSMTTPQQHDIDDVNAYY
jgi:hypothetical protein